MYRTTPTWYLDGLSQVMLHFSSTMSTPEKPRNLLLISSFPSPDLESDGVHLTPYSGYEYVLYLFDSSESALKSLSKSPESFVIDHSESIRTLEDRVVVLERDHQRLNRFVEHKSAVDAKKADHDINKANEDLFIISGLPRAPSGLSTKEWQDRVKLDVTNVIQILLGRESVIKVVHNQTGTKRATVYQVQMEDSRDACAIRRKFGSFFSGGKDSRPPSLKDISIGNWVTPATKVRIAILKVLASRYRASNPGSRTQVVGYEARPLLRITPPTTSSDRRTKTYNFIEAVRSFPTNFTPDQVSSIMSKVNPKLYSSLRALFIVISDDMPKVHQVRVPGSAQSIATAADPESGSQPHPEPQGPTESLPSLPVVSPSSDSSQNGSRQSSGSRTSGKRSNPSPPDQTSKSSRHR